MAHPDPAVFRSRKNYHPSLRCRATGPSGPRIRLKELDLTFWALVWISGCSTRTGLDREVEGRGSSLGAFMAANSLQLARPNPGRCVVADQSSGKEQANMPDAFDKLAKSLQEIEDLILNTPERLEDLRKRFQRDRYFAPIDGHHSVQHFLQETTCSEAFMYLVSGNDTTNNAGECELNLNDIVRCRTVDRGFFALISPPQFTASPANSTPALLTASSSVTEEPGPAGLLYEDRGKVSSYIPLKVRITVNSWKLDGSAASKIPFSWICTIEVGRRIPLGDVWPR